jgi:hypothetical protein
MQAVPTFNAATRCICFRRFRAKHIELSETYWRHVIGAEAVEIGIAKAQDTRFAVEVLGIATKQHEYGHTVSETREKKEDYLNRTRLHLLSICCANLESLLHDATYAHVLSLGYRAKPGELSKTGEALAAPILTKASLPQPLEYAEQLFNVSFGAKLARMKTAYRYRCAAVHNGGVVTAKTVKDLSLRPNRLNSMLGYSWPDLKQAMQDVVDIGRDIATKAACYEFRIAEIERELCALRDAGLLDKAKVWQEFHDQGFLLPHKKDREPLIASVLSSS